MNYSSLKNHWILEVRGQSVMTILYHLIDYVDVMTNCDVYYVVRNDKNKLFSMNLPGQSKNIIKTDSLHLTKYIVR